MRNKLNWAEKYKLSLKSRFSISDMCNLMDIGKDALKGIREECIDYCRKNNINRINGQIPSEVFFEITKLNTDYYYEKMEKEAKYYNCISNSSIYRMGYAL